MAVTQYAALMDEINKEIQKEKHKNKNINNNSTCLLWVDDFAIITNNKEDQKELLKITTETSNKYRIQFGKNKSKIMPIGNKIPQPKLYINKMEIENCENYKYLGETLYIKNNLNLHIQEIKRKTEAAIQTLFYIAGNENFQGITLLTMWTLLETSVIPIITYASETWELTKMQTKQLNSMLDNTIKRILMVPQTTPRECIYKELGILDIEHRIIIKRLSYARILQTKPNDAATKILEDRDENAWITKTKQKMVELGIVYTHLEQININDTKRIILQATQNAMTRSTDQSGETKAKYKFLTEGRGDNNNQPSDYLKHLPRNQARALFMARKRMLKVKANYKKMYVNHRCRGCGLTEETRDHVLQECTIIHQNQDLITTKEDLFKPFDNQTKQIATNIITIEKIIEKWNQA